MSPAAGIPCLAPAIVTAEGALVSPLRASGTIYSSAVFPLLRVAAVHRAGLRAILRTPATAPRAVPELVRVSTGKVLSSCFGASAESLTRLHVFGCASVELLSGALVPVRHSLTVFRIVLPFAPAALTGRYLVLVLAPVDVVIDIRVSVNVDIDIAATPVAASPRVAPRRTHGDTHPNLYAALIKFQSDEYAMADAHCNLDD